MLFVVHSDTRMLATIDVRPVGPVESADCTITTREHPAESISAYRAFEYLNLALRDADTTVEAFI